MIYLFSFIYYLFIEHIYLLFDLQILYSGYICGNYLSRLMLNNKYNIVQKELIFLLLVIIPLFSYCQNGAIQHLKFKQLSTLNGLPTDEVQKVFQDKNGYIWIATRSGLCLYDGYQVKTYKANLYTPELFTNNDILCVADDNDNNLWIGTLDGLNILNKKTGAIRKISIPGVNNTISCLLITKDNTVWIGTDSGLCRYIPQNDSFELLDKTRTGNVLNTPAIKSLIEDSNGNIWIGTWSAGLYRYNPKLKRYYAYPKMNARNSAHVIYEDYKKRIWVGTWDEGLFMIENPYDMKHLRWKRFVNQKGNPNSLSDNIVYSISEDFNTHTLWVGTRSGLSITGNNNVSDSFINYLPESKQYPIINNEVNSIIRDRSGMMWIGTIGGGVCWTSTRQTHFNLYNIESIKHELPTNSVQCLYVDDQGLVWMGIGTYGLGVYNPKTNICNYYPKITEFSGITGMPTVNTIVKVKRTNELWIGTYDGGIFAYKKGQKVKVLLPENTPYLKDACVSAIMEDSKGNCWIGTRSGLCIRYNNGKGYIFRTLIAGNKDLGRSTVRSICEDRDGTIWCGTGNYGVIRISGNPQKPATMKFAHYSLMNKKLNCIDALCFFKDKAGRLWLGTEGGGLNLYDREKDTFVSVNKLINLPGDVVSSIQQDSKGNLWLGTNYGLVRLHVANELKESSFRVYTTADGLQDNFFIQNSSFNKNGELFFGGYKGYNSFFPDKMADNAMKDPVVITDIKIFNQSFGTLDNELRNRISKETPGFTKRIELPYKYKNFTIEFAALVYNNSRGNKFAYKLEGFDKDWQYTDASRRFANYNNLKSGTYTFRLKATNENGVWNDAETTLEVVILPPLWATWWAYLIYIIVAALITRFSLKAVRNRIQLRNDLKIQQVEQAKSEEVNHVKLQFFTNITHELLTPLTIISATVDDLKMISPQNNEHYAVMQNNISRLIRLLQQILEFRKAETGNLKLKVSNDNLAAFVKKEVESLRPLMKKKKMHLSVVCDPENIFGYFDPDKLDKIVYNLLSNASKYNNEGGFVQVNLSYDSEKEYAVLTIKDNGQGIPPEKVKTLFRRFYEGDYRRFNTIGTGIGLSLTKDLVELHQGTITVESELDKGTSFCVKIPIDRSYYNDDEIDDLKIAATEGTISDLELSVPEPERPAETKSHSLLVIEDNEELLQLMTRLLSREYNIFTAQNGKEGIAIVENEDVDLIVSDIMMPEMDGIEFCKHLKSNFETCHIPLILLTAKNKEEDRIEAYDSGADGFISKPFKLPVLHAKIKNLLKGKERVAKDFKKQLVFEAKELNYTSIDEEFLQRAIDCVYKHLDDSEFDQQQFIEEMGSSKSTLYKKLKSLTGLNTSAFIRNIRLKAACKIVEEKKRIRISELAYAVGFNDPKYFSACFKKEFGMLPSEYIERYLPESFVQETEENE